MKNTKLSVLHFSTADTLGGSARSAYRIHSGLKKRQHISRMLVGHKFSHDPDVSTVYSNRLGYYLDRLADKTSALTGFQYQCIPSSYHVKKHHWVNEADVFQLYNTHGGYFAQHLLAGLSAKARIVWRLSDLWPMTGHCAYPGDCEGWMHGCVKCPDIDAYPAIGLDRAARLYDYKARLYEKAQPVIVAPSSWTELQARKSPLLGDCDIFRIPNGLDGTVFRPGNTREAKRRLGLDDKRKVILFCAHVLDNNPRKGADILKQALTRMGSDPDFVLALVGEGGEGWNDELPCDVKLLGFQDSAELLAQCYVAADMVVIPSVQENLPNTLIEALACGCPAVASDCGGMQDGVVHGETGYLVTEKNPAELADSIQALLDNDTLRLSMGAASRQLFENEFDIEKEISRFESLYYSLI